MDSRQTPKTKSTQKREYTFTKKPTTNRKDPEVGVLNVNTTPTSKRPVEIKTIDQREDVLDAISTPRSKENKPVTLSSGTKIGKKTWNRRPKPAHSGVPIPEKMKRLKELQFIIKKVDKDSVAPTTA